MSLWYCTDTSEDSCASRDLIKITVPELNKMAKFVNLTTDHIINYDENVKPKEIVIEDKSTVFKIIDKMLNRKKFKNLFNTNVEGL